MLSKNQRAKETWEPAWHPPAAHSPPAVGPGVLKFLLPHPVGRELDPRHQKGQAVLRSLTALPASWEHYTLCPWHIPSPEGPQGWILGQSHPKEARPPKPVNPSQKPQPLPAGESAAAAGRPRLKVQAEPRHPLPPHLYPGLQPLGV